MNELTSRKLLKLLFLFCLPLLLGSCKVGEEDPFISFRSRDNRVKGTWQLTSMENRYELNSFEIGQAPVNTVVNTWYDGYDLRVQTFVNNALVRDSVFGFSYQMRLKESGLTTYDYTVIYFGLAGLKSGGEDNWYWLNNDKKKARLHVGDALQYPVSVGLPVQLPAAFNFLLGSLVTDFEVEKLSNKELRLIYNKATEQTTATGGLQKVLLNSKMVFDSK